jgi:hypothetical protein
MKIKKVANSFFKWRPYGFLMELSWSGAPGLWANKIAFARATKDFCVRISQMRSITTGINNKRLVVQKKERAGLSPRPLTLSL